MKKPCPKCGEDMLGMEACFNCGYGQVSKSIKPKPTTVKKSNSNPNIVSLSIDLDKTSYQKLSKIAETLCLTPDQYIKKIVLKRLES